MSRDKPDSSSQGGLRLQTLVVSAGAAVAAAVIVPLFWAQGTLIATAMTPVIVALASELLRRPVERVSAAAPRVARRSATGVAVRRFEPQAARTREPERIGARGQGPERLPQRPVPGISPEDPFGLRRAHRRPRWPLAVATGLLAFLIAAALVTASELTIFGGSVSGERGRTTLFGGGRPASPEDRAGGRQHAPAQRESTPTATPTATPTPQATPTPAPARTPTPSPTPTPAAPSRGASPQPAPMP